MASTTSRIEVLRGRPPLYTGMNGLISDHCASVKSLGYGWVRIPYSTQLRSWKHPYRTDSECVSSRGIPQPLISRFTGTPTTIEGRRDLNARWDGSNAYYPSPEMHLDAAQS